MFPVATEVFAARGDDGALLFRIGYMTDVSARRAVEEERQALQRRFETAFSDAPIGMTLDAETTSDQDVLVAADIAMYEAKGAGGDRICVGGPARPLS